MTAISLDQPRLARVLPAPTYTRVLAGWHVVHLLLVLAAIAAVGGTTLGAGTVIGVRLVLVLTALGDGIAVVGLLRGRHSGRMAALVIDYLTFVGAAVTLLQHTDVFTGLDALGETFFRGVPFLILAIVAYAATAYERLRVVARWVAVAAMAGLLLSVGLVQGSLTFASRTATSPVALALVVLGGISLLAAIRTKQSDVARHLGATTRSTHVIDGLLFVSPNVLGFLAFFAGPLLFSLWMSLNNWDAFGTPEFIGMANYVRILSLSVATAEAGQLGNEVLLSGYTEVLRIGRFVVGAQDPLFWKSITNIIIFAGLAIPLSVIPALFLATLLNSDAPGIKLFRALYFVPAIAGVVAVALIWRQLFNSTVGWINFLLGRIAGWWNAVPGLPDWDPGQPQWLSSTGLALISLVIVFSWQYIGFNTVLFLAGLQSVDPTLHEAAMLDGANRWQRFRHITLPQLAPTTFFVVASTGILALQLFGEAVVMFPTFTPIGAGPQNSTLTPVVYLYDQGFRRFAQGYASAVAWVLFLLIFAFTFIQFQRQREQAEGI